MATSKPFRNIDEQLRKVSESLKIIASHINSDGDLTEEGKNNSWDRYTAPHRVYIAEVEQALEKIAKNVDDAATAARDKALPTATRDTAKVATELELQRILGRGIPSSMDDIHRLIKSMEPTPTRTALVHELQERKILSSEVVSAILEDITPEIKATAELAVQHARIASVAKYNLQAAQKLLNDRRSSLHWVHLARTDTDLDLAIPGHVFLRPWTATNAETVYRAR